MNKIFIYFLSFLFLAGISCTDVLNQKSVDSLDEDVVFSDINMVDAYVNACYSMLGSSKMSTQNQQNGPLIRRDFVSSSTDQTLNNFRVEPLLAGTMSPDLMDVLNLWNNPDNGRPWLFWTFVYQDIQNLNIILSRIDDVPVKNPTEEALRTQLKGETYFLRALSCTNLMMCYGGLVLSDKPFGINDDYSAIKRSSISDTKDFILSDIANAIQYLPEQMEQGRATRGAAAALKSRMLLFCTGKLTNGGWAEQANNELVSFPAGSQKALLEAARDAAKDIIDGKYGTYALVGNTAEPVLPLSDAAFQKCADDYFSIFHQSSNAPWNSEIIWGTQYPASSGRIYTPNMWLSARGYDGASNNQPTEDAVRKYEMADGTPFVWNAAGSDKFSMRSATADELAANPNLNPYNGREARFYASVLYNGAPWVARPTAAQSSDPYNKMQFGYRYRQNSGGDFPANPSYSGLDTRQSSANFNTAANATKTGYTLRKFLNPDMNGDHSNDLTNITVWVEFRYAEVLLNYAEACIELGGADLQNGINAMNLVRHRVGLPSRVTANQDEAREFIRHERDVELFGEGERFFDMRRWMICDSVIQDVYGMRINEYVAGDDDYNILRTTWQLDPNNRVDVRSWPSNSFYWLPIARGEMTKSPGLVQNPGYN